MWLPNMALDGEPEELEVYEEPNKELTPFEKAGYTKDAKFKVLGNWGSLKKGDIVTLDEDDGTICPRFKTEDGRCGSMWLPNMAPKGCREELEVCEGPNTKNDIDCELSTIITSLKFKISEIEDIVGSLQKLKDNS